MKEIEVGPPQAGQRLDAALSALAPELSRSAWQNLIKDSKIKVNKRIVRQPSKTVKAGDAISASIPKKDGQPPEVSILYQDDDVIVFDKPAGLLTHAKGPLAEEWTLADIARPLVEDDGTNRPGIVHRLDRATSGVIILAKTKAAKANLHRQFASRQVEKKYLAITAGQVEEKEFKIDLPIARDPKAPKKFAARKAGKPAQTGVKVIKATPEASWLELKPKTGRTHQLRVHLKAAGHPIIGDDLYGGQPAERLYLHAQKLGLKLPSGKHMEFEAPLPDDFKRGMEQYGLG